MPFIISRRTILCAMAGGAAGSLLGPRAARAAITGKAVYPVAVPLYAPQFVAFTQGFFKDEGLDVELISSGSGTNMRDLIASGQADVGIGDVSHALQLTNRGRPAKVLSAIDRRSVLVVIVSSDAHASGLTSIDQLATWKRRDGGKPVIGVSSIGGTAYVWSTFAFEQAKLDQAVSFIALGRTDTMLGALRSRQIDALVGSPAMLADADKRGWGRLLFDIGDKGNWDRVFGGDVPITGNLANASLIERDRQRVQAYTNALYRAALWMDSHSVEDVYAAVEQYVGKTSPEANLIELKSGKETLNVSGVIEEAAYQAASARCRVRSYTN